MAQAVSSYCDVTCPGRFGPFSTGGHCANICSSNFQVPQGMMLNGPDGNPECSEMGYTSMPCCCYGIACGQTCTQNAFGCSQGSQCGAGSGTAAGGTLNCSGGVCTCTCAPASCVNPFGGPNIPHNGTITAYQNSSVACGNVCISEVRTCNNGVLSGSFTNQTCSVAACPGCAGPATMTCPDGTVLTRNAFPACDFPPCGSGMRCTRSAPSTGTCDMYCDPAANFSPCPAGETLTSGCMAGPLDPAPLCRCMPCDTCIDPPTFTCPDSSVVTQNPAPACDYPACAASSTCAGPGTMTCASGAVVTRNPFPACDFPACPPPTCTTNTATYTIQTLPMNLTVTNSSIACGGSGGVTVHEIRTLPFSFSPATTPTTFRSLGSQVTHTWLTDTPTPTCAGAPTFTCPDSSVVTRNAFPACDFPACPPSTCAGPPTMVCPDGITVVTRSAFPGCTFPACPPPVCAGPATYTCLDGTVLTRNPFPACDFPACPPPSGCLADGDVCKLAGMCGGGPEAADYCVSDCCSLGMTYNVAVPGCFSDEKRCGSGVCPLPASQLCLGGTTVTRNAFPDCSMPSCPPPPAGCGGVSNCHSSEPGCTIGSPCGTGGSWICNAPDSFGEYNCTCSGCTASLQINCDEYNDALMPSGSFVGTACYDTWAQPSPMCASQAIPANQFQPCYLCPGTGSCP